MRGHGEGTITKRSRTLKDGREVVTYQAAVALPAGRRAFRYCRTYREAQSALKDMVRARDQNQPVTLTSESVAHFSVRWLQVKEGRAAKTHQEYSNQIR